MTTSNMPMNSNQLYHWHADNLLTATQSINSQWHGKTDDIQRINATHITTDTRKIQAGDIFLALKGENFDGHDYVTVAVEKGAVAVVVSQLQAVDVPQLLVSDTRLALGQLGAYRRNQHPNLKVIAITGSSGKTTCKEMLGSIFNRIAPTLMTRGNLNNDLGVPMMLLELQDNQQFAILELGANHVGEIAYTTQLVRPDVACILNIGTAHLGEFGSRDNICLTKAEIYQGLTSTQTAIIPKNDDYADKLYAIAKQYTKQIICFGANIQDEVNLTISAEDVTVEAEYSKFTLVIDKKRVAITLPFAGEHNISNALASASCAVALGVSIEDIAIGLSTAIPPKGRLNIQAFGQHRLIDDTYNANPHAVRAGVQVLKKQQGKTMLVLGDIAELGEATTAEHYQLGQDIAKMGIDTLYCVGEFTKNTVAGADAIGGLHAEHFADKTSLFESLRQQLSQGQTQTWNVLFKGSRTMQMESLIKDLLAEI